MRVLMIGTGSIGHRHMASLRRCVPGVAFDVLREAGRSNATAGLGPVTVSTTLDEALDKSPTLMIIANPSSLHLRPLLAAIDRGVPFYVEKPVVASAEDLQRLRQAIGQAGLPPHIVGCNLRFLPSLQRLKALLDSGELGTVVRASFEAGQWLPDWRPAQDYRESYSARADLGGGVLFDLIHEIDAARWLLGEFTQVHGLTGHVSSLDIETEDCACLVLGRAGGPLATVQLDYVSRRPVRRYVIVGESATAEWDLQRRTLTMVRPDSIDMVELQPVAYEVGETYPAAMHELLAAIEAGRPSCQPIEEGLRALDIVMQVRASGFSG